MAGVASTAGAATGGARATGCGVGWIGGVTWAGGGRGTDVPATAGGGNVGGTAGGGGALTAVVAGVATGTPGVACAVTAGRCRSFRARDT